MTQVGITVYLIEKESGAQRQTHLPRVTQPAIGRNSWSGVKARSPTPAVLSWGQFCCPPLGDTRQCLQTVLVVTPGVGMRLAPVGTGQGGC